MMCTAHRIHPRLPDSWRRNQIARLRKLDPAVARRRLTGMLLRWGFDFETIKPVGGAALGAGDEMDDFG